MLGGEGEGCEGFGGGEVVEGCCFEGRLGGGGGEGGGEEGEGNEEQEEWDEVHCGWNGVDRCLSSRLR